MEILFIKAKAVHLVHRFGRWAWLLAALLVQVSCAVEHVSASTAFHASPLRMALPSKPLCGQQVSFNVLGYPMTLLFTRRRTIAGTYQHAHFIPMVAVGKRGILNWSMLTCQGSTRSELP